jgi:hypothetical protein
MAVAALAIAFALGCGKTDSSAAPPVSSAISAALTPPFDAGVARYVPDAGRRACGADLTGAGEMAIAKLSNETLASAIVELSGSSLRARAFKRDDGSFVVVDCMGHTSRTDWSGKDPSRESGVLELIARQELPGGKLVVWLASGMAAAPCSGENGFLAILHVDRSRLVVDGVSDWTSSCGNAHKLRIEKLDGESLYVEDDTAESGGGRRAWQNIWRLKAPNLELALHVDVGRAPASSCDGPSMSAQVRFAGRDVTVEESWQKPKDCPGGGGAPRKVKRRWKLGESAFTQIEGPPPASE